MRFNLCMWFGEISSCSCLTVLPGPAWVLLNWICKELISSLYMVVCKAGLSQEAQEERHSIVLLYCCSSYDLRRELILCGPRYVLKNNQAPSFDICVVYPRGTNSTRAFIFTTSASIPSPTIKWGKLKPRMRQNHVLVSPALRIYYFK